MRRVNADSPRRARPAAPRAARRLAVPPASSRPSPAAFAYVGAVDPNEPGHYPVCPLLRFTGIYCPGCGGLRSAHAFVHGDLAAALRTTPSLSPAIWSSPCCGPSGWSARCAAGRCASTSPPVHLWALGTLLLVFTVVRNLPFGGWLHP